MRLITDRGVTVVPSHTGALLVFKDTRGNQFYCQIPEEAMDLGRRASAGETVEFTWHDVDPRVPPERVRLARA